MSQTREVKVIVFPTDGPVHLVPLIFKLSEKPDNDGITILNDDGSPTLFPSSVILSELARVRTNGSDAYHIITPGMMEGSEDMQGVDTQQFYLMYWGGGTVVNPTLAQFTEGRADPGMTGNIVVLKMDHEVFDTWQDANLEIDLPLLKKYLSWFPGN